MFRIIFICTGNTCRSPMAEFLLKNILKNERLDDLVEVRSAGLAALPGDPINEKARSVLFEDYRIDTNGHRSTAVTDYLLDEQDLILTMTTEHADRVRMIRPDLSDKVFTVIEYYLEALKHLDAGAELPPYTSLSVADPLGQARSVYQDTAAMLQEYLLTITEFIRFQLG